jgi:hypothetical protein
MESGHKQASGKLKQNWLVGIDPRQAETCKRELRKTLVNMFRKSRSKPQSQHQLGVNGSYDQVYQVRERPLLYIVLD